MPRVEDEAGRCEVVEAEIQLLHNLREHRLSPVRRQVLVHRYSQPDWSGGSRRCNDLADIAQRRRCPVDPAERVGRAWEDVGIGLDDDRVGDAGGKFAAGARKSGGGDPTAAPFSITLRYSRSPHRSATLRFVLTVVFWSAIAGLVWAYAGYPALVAVLGRLRPLRLDPSGPIPSITVAIAVHNEAEAIAERVQDVLAQAGADVVEVIVGSDGSTDGTDARVGALANLDPRVRLVALPRSGQTATQHALFEAANGDVVVLTDAETRFEEGCLERLVAPFRDRRVDCTTGRIEWRDVGATATAANEGLYWRYERTVRALESRAGLLTAVTGALLAVRRTAYRPVPHTASMDHLLPLYVRERGALVVYVPEARATDRPISGLREQFRNRSRTATRGIAANFSMAGRLAPWRQPGAAMAIWSHKLLRWATPWLGIAAVGSAIALAVGGQTLYGVVPATAGLGSVGAVAGHVLSRNGRRPPALLGFLRALAVVNSAFLVAWANVVRGRRIEAWYGVEFELARRHSLPRPEADARD